MRSGCTCVVTPSCVSDRTACGVIVAGGGWRQEGAGSCEPRCKSLVVCFPGGTVVKDPPASTGDTRDEGSNSGLGRSSRGRKYYKIFAFLVFLMLSGLLYASNNNKYMK